VREETFGFGELAAAMERAGAEGAKKVARVTGMACNQMKKDAKARVRGFPHLKHLGRSFTYDVTTSGSRVVGEVGAEHERLQGRLDWVAEYGTPTSAPIPHWRPAADKEVPVWMGFLQKVAGEALDD
jgi:hypothetical protein